jgi:glycosyltransferase involved in cell wall biosynthesis
VSIVIPAYNAARYLPDAVRSALDQPGATVEVVIVNDGSTDDTAAVADRLAAADPRVRVIHQANGHCAAARNTGIRVARGEYISFLDADDVFLPDKSRLQAEFLDAHPEYDLVYSDFSVADASLVPTRLHARGEPPVPFETLYVYRNWFATTAVLLRASLVRAVGGFDETLSASEDWDYWIRCAKHGQFGYVPGVVALYRVHGNQTHRMFDRRRRAELQIVTKHYAHDPARYRAAVGARHWDYARNHFGRRHPFHTARHLFAMALTVRSPREMRRVVEMTWPVRRSAQ